MKKEKEKPKSHELMSQTSRGLVMNQIKNINRGMAPTVPSMSYNQKFQVALICSPNNNLYIPKVSFGWLLESSSPLNKNLIGTP